MDNEADISEEARLVAVLKGNWLAKWLPGMWRKWVRGECGYNQNSPIMKGLQKKIMERQ